MRKRNFSNVSPSPRFTVNIFQNAIMRLTEPECFFIFDNRNRIRSGRSSVSRKPAQSTCFRMRLLITFGFIARMFQQGISCSVLFYIVSSLGDEKKKRVRQRETCIRTSFEPQLSTEIFIVIR